MIYHIECIINETNNHHHFEAHCQCGKTLQAGGPYKEGLVGGERLVYTCANCSTRYTIKVESDVGQA